MQWCKILTLLNIKRTLDNTIKAHTQSKKWHVFSFFQTYAPSPLPPPSPLVPWPMETEKTGNESETEENDQDMFCRLPPQEIGELPPMGEFRNLWGERGEGGGRYENFHLH